MPIELPADYEQAREAFRDAEVELMLQRERVAEMRRSLPPGPVVDYTFLEGPADLAADGPVAEVAIRDLFSGPSRPLVLYHFMLGKRQEQPCPSCTMWTDGWNALAEHLAQNIDFAVVAAAPVDQWREYARSRGWSGLRLLSADDSSFKRDIGGEADDGSQWPFLSVYELDGDDVRLTYSGGAHISGEHWRGVDLLSPVWHFLDLTRPGRGDWMPSLSY